MARNDLAVLRERMNPWLTDYGTHQALDPVALDPALAEAEKRAREAYKAALARTDARGRADQAYETTFKEVFLKVFDARRRKE